MQQSKREEFLLDLGSKNEWMKGWICIEIYRMNEYA